MNAMSQHNKSGREGREAVILETLADAEKRLLSLLAEAASQGDYDGIDFASESAARLNQLREELAARHARRLVGVIETESPKRTLASARSKKDGGRRKGSFGKYPHFAVLEGSLVKTGWSKRDKAAYQQRVSNSAFRDVVNALAQFAKHQAGSVPTDQILDAISQTSAKPPPSYQAYIVLAFLRAAGAVRQLTRGAYAIPSDVESLAILAWEKNSEGEES